MKRFFVVLFAVVLSSCQQPDPKIEAWQTALDEAFNASVEDGFSGAVYVAKGDTVLLDKAAGTIGGYPMETDTRFWISSTGKQFVAASVMKAMEEGFLDLDDPVSRFFPGAPAGKKDITIRQLMSHTSGFGQSYVSEEATNFQEAAVIILAQDLIDTPGAAFHYSNNNFQLSVAILEKVAGEPYHQFLARELLLPLGIRNTGQTGPEAGHLVAPTQGGTPDRLFEKQWGGQGMFSTTHNLAAWFNALTTGKILKPETVGAMFRPVSKISEGFAGLGWFIREAPNGAKCVFVRGNDDYGPNSLVYGYPDDGIVIVILTHGGYNADDVSYSRAMLAALEPVLFPKAD